MKFEKLEPTTDNDLFIGWVNNPHRKVCSRVFVEYTNRDGVDIARLNSSTDYVRTRRMIDSEGKEKILISVKQGDTIYLPLFYTFDDKAFIKKVNNVVTESTEYEILLRDRLN